MSKVRVLVYPVGEPPRAELVENELRAFQDLVGGYIEVVGLEALPDGGSIDLICNENGLLEQLPFNRMVEGYHIVGQFLIARHNAEGEVVSLSEDDVTSWWRALP